MNRDISYQLGKEAITGGSKSFRLASLLLDKKSQRGAYLLYRWCRHCDDQIDEATNRDQALAALNLLKTETQTALEAPSRPSESVFSGLSYLNDEFQIPHHYFYDMIQGFESDSMGAMIESFEDLMTYCYRVAGVVGLMMSPILGVTESTALTKADALGRAMQLTNICRDVVEDFHNRRIYIPKRWLDEEQIEPIELTSEKNEKRLFKLVLRLLDCADELYREGRQGLQFLPLRAAWSISVASFLYQGIGHEIRRRGAVALRKRTILSRTQKGLAFVRGSCFFIKDRFFKKHPASVERNLP